MRITIYEKGGNSLNPFIKLSIFLMIILCLFVIPVSAEWTIDSNIVTGLNDVGKYSTPTVFQDDSTFKLITGEEFGTFIGYYWDGSTWVLDSNIVSGLVDVGAYSTPCVFQDDSTFKLITGEQQGTFIGYYWDGSTWVLDSNIVSGLGDIGLWSAPYIFIDDDTFKLISGETDGIFNGYYWNGSAWILDSNIVSGLGDIGDNSKLTIFYDNSMFKLISGGYLGGFNGYYWDDSTWVLDINITSGINNVGWYSAPTVFLDGNLLKLIIGEFDGVFNGYTIPSIASAAAPEFDDVSWDYDTYYTGETANITTNILNFDTGTYSYYLDLYNTQEYLTTYEITSETESNYYTFPTEWTDTSLLAKLQRVTDPYGSNEINLAMDLSHFETLNWDTTISFNKSSYNPSEILKVTWSGAPTGSTIWLRAMDDGEIIKPNVDYSGSFEFTIPSNTEETYYIVDVIVNGVSQAQASCVINLGDYFTDDYIFVTNYTFNDGDTYGLHYVDRAEYLNVTTETNINTDFVDVYYNNVYDDRMVSIDHIENLDGTDQILKFPNDLGSGQYITIIYYHNISTGTQAELSYYTNVGEKGEGIDIYNAVITLDDTKEIMDIQSIAGYVGNDLVIPFDRIIIFDIYADEIINSTIITENYRYEGDANYNSTADYHIKRSFLFDVLGLAEIQFEVHNDATNTDDIIKYNVYVQGIDQTELDGSVVMYWTKSNIEIGGTGLLYFNVSGLTTTPTLTITSTTESKYATLRTLYTNQTGTESVLTDEAGVYTAVITDAEGIVYAISTLTITDPTVIIEDDVIDTTLQDNTNNLLNSPYLIGLLIMAVFLAVGSTNGICGMIVTGSMGLGIVCYMGIFPWILLVIEVLVVAALFSSGLIKLSGD